ncbi:MAG: glucuronate isomerase [Flavobacteriaceae bacterium]|nr:glucuronate isomerase [Flavobacteriaceae bacterium]
MSSLITEDFLLETDHARILYHDYIKDLPLIDYHNHLSAGDISQDSSFENITQVWMSDDHYKWRAMRTLGIDEKYITGRAEDYDKFEQYARAVPYLIRNPLYHWSHLELKRYFGFDELLDGSNSRSVYDLTRQILKTPEYTCRGLLKQMKVEYLCTTEDPLDDLVHHRTLRKSDFTIGVNTAFRPDKFLCIDRIDFQDCIMELSKIVNKEIQTFQDLLEGLLNRMEYFHNNGCRLSDHGIDTIPFSRVSDNLVEQIFSKRLRGMKLTKLEIAQFQTSLLLFLSQNYHRLGWIQQFHIGAYRNTNTRMYKKMGSDKGWDSIGDFTNLKSLMSFLDQLDQNSILTKTIIYNLNPSENAIMATLVGNFNDGTIKGKIQWGASWWYLDQLDGITNHLNTLSNVGVLSCFIGMLTDSRSFLSFPRHEYFRRILCNILGNDIRKGHLPRDYKWLGKIASDISYHNVKQYFNLT